jgi:ribonuclease Z
MARLIMLGTASPTPDAHRNNTFMALQGNDGYFLIDCAGCPLQTLQQAGLPLDRLQGIIVTHRHPDHIYGLPVLILGLWLNGRRSPLVVIGEEETLATVSALFEIFRSEEWPELFNLLYEEVALQPEAQILDNDDFCITASPMKHLVPTLALKIAVKSSGKTVVYSSDTEPCKEMIRFAQDADLLIHEATGNGIGHTSSVQAAEIARQSQVQRLVLVHLPAMNADLAVLHREAMKVFGENVHLANDYDVFEL